MMIAWSTRGQTRRSHPTTPLAPLSEDTPRHRPRQCPLFVAAEQGASRRYYRSIIRMRGEEGPAFTPIKLKNFLAFRYAKQGRRLRNGSEIENRTQKTG